MQYFGVYTAVLIGIVLVACMNTIREGAHANSNDEDVTTDDKLSQFFSEEIAYLSLRDALTEDGTMNDCVRIAECIKIYRALSAFETMDPSQLIESYPKTITNSDDVNMLRQIIFASKHIMNALTFGPQHAYTMKYTNFGVNKGVNTKYEAWINPNLPVATNIDAPIKTHTQCDSSVDTIRKPLMQPYKLVYQGLAYFAKPGAPAKSVYPGDTRMTVY